VSRGDRLRQALPEPYDSCTGSYATDFGPNKFGFDGFFFTQTGPARYFGPATRGETNFKTDILWYKFLDKNDGDKYQLGDTLNPWFISRSYDNRQTKDFELAGAT